MPDTIIAAPAPRSGWRRWEKFIQAVLRIFRKRRHSG